MERLVRRILMTYHRHGSMSDQTVLHPDLACCSTHTRTASHLSCGESVIVRSIEGRQQRLQLSRVEMELLTPALTTHTSSSLRPILLCSLLLCTFALSMLLLRCNCHHLLVDAPSVVAIEEGAEGCS